MRDSGQQGARQAARHTADKAWKETKPQVLCVTLRLHGQQGIKQIQSAEIAGFRCTAAQLTHIGQAKCTVRFACSVNTPSHCIHCMNTPPPFPAVSSHNHKQSPQAPRSSSHRGSQSCTQPKMLASKELPKPQRSMQAHPGHACGHSHMGCLTSLYKGHTTPGVRHDTRGHPCPRTRLHPTGTARQ